MPISFTKLRAVAAQPQLGQPAGQSEAKARILGLVDTGLYRGRRVFLKRQDPSYYLPLSSGRQKFLGAHCRLAASDRPLGQVTTSLSPCPVAGQNLRAFPGTSQTLACSETLRGTLEAGLKGEDGDEHFVPPSAESPLPQRQVLLYPVAVALC